LACSQEVALQRTFALLRRVSGARNSETPVKFLLNHGRIFEQPHHFGPDGRVQQVLPNGPARAARTTEMPPPIRSEAAIVVNQPRTRPGRRPRQRIATPTAAHEALHETRRAPASTRSDFVLLQQFLRAGKDWLVDERRHRNLNPVLAGPFVIGAIARGRAASHSQRPRQPLTCRDARLPEARRAAIGRIAQHRPDRRALPTRAGLARGDAFVIEPPHDRRDAPSRHRVVLKDLPHDARLHIEDGIRRRRVIGLANVPVAVRGATQHADFARSGPMTLAASRPLEDLGPFVLGDHALELNEELVLRRRALRRVQKTGFDAVTGELLDQQNLIGIFATQPIRAVDENGLNLSVGRQVAHTLQARAFERGPAIAVVFEDPGLRHFDVECPRQLDQRCRLAHNRVRLALLLRGDPRVNRCHPHAGAPSSWRRAGVLASGPESRRPGRAWWLATDRRCNRAERTRYRGASAAHPRRRWKAPRNPVSACVTICPSVRPLRRAYARSARTRLTGSLKVIATVGSTAVTGALSAAACSR